MSTTSRGALTGSRLIAVLHPIVKRGVVLGALAAALLVPQPAAAVPTVDGEFPIASEFDTNNKIAVGPDGNMWMTANTPDKDVVRITPAGAVTEYDIDAVTAKGIAAGPNGKIWITRGGGVISFDAADPEGTFQATGIATIMGFHSIALGPDGNLWVATEGNLVRINPANPAENKSFAVAGLGPRDIDVFGSGLVVADAGTPRILIASTADPPVISEVKLNGSSQGVAGGSSGILAFTEPGANPETYGLLTPPGPPLRTEAQTDPFGVTPGSDSAFWIAQFTTDSLIRLAPDNKSTELKGFAPESGPRQIAGGPGHTLWVTLQKSQKVGRVSGLEPPSNGIKGPPPPAAPETKIDGGPKGKVTAKGKRKRVKFRFSSPSAGATFECRLVRIVKVPVPKKRKALAVKLPAFKGCSSPKRYRLGPGRYRFEVRAVLAGQVDPTPAKRSFRIVRAPGP